MPERKPAAKSTKKVSSSKAKGKTSPGFSAEEKAAAKERVRELRAEAKGANEEAAVLAAIAKMPPSDRALAKRFHELVKESAPGLAPKTWYGMPAYAKDGKVLCFFRDAAKFKERYAMIGFQDNANIDKGAMWPVAYAVTKFTAAEEKQIAALVKKAVS